MLIPVKFVDLLLLLFIALKLVGVIDWSWWWVTSPLWGAFVILLCGGQLRTYAKYNRLKRKDNRP